ncbi:MAG: adenylate/guanylate cyclase domain-containing protein [Pseudomonadota bacterium]
MSGVPSAAAARIADWMVECALGSATAAEAFGGLCERLRDEGVQVDRGQLSFSTLHPLHSGSGATWTIDGGLELVDYAHDDGKVDDGWMNSPFRHMIVTKTFRLRRRLVGPTAMLDFPMLRTLKAAGLADYLGLLCGFDSFLATPDERDDPASSVSGLACSFSTARPSGFSDLEVETIQWLLRPLGVVVKMADQRQIAVNLARCYIGREAGPRVLGGAIRRGDFDSTEAVVWLSDLRRSTEMSMSMPREAFLETLNAFFDRTAGAVEEEGGETLSFIGDASLAIFPIEALGVEGARRAALRAARRADDALARYSDERAAAGRSPLGWSVALHAGTLEYGNIGSLGRHSWTAIGPVVNETARLEGTTKLTGERIVASRAFIAPLNEPWRPLGAFDLPGVPQAFEVFAPPTPVGVEREEMTA